MNFVIGSIEGFGKIRYQTGFWSYV